jgi:hypothetical protein
MHHPLPEQLRQVGSADPETVQSKQAGEVGPGHPGEAGPVAREDVAVDGDLDEPRLQQLEGRDARKNSIDR